MENPSHTQKLLKCHDEQDPSSSVLKALDVDKMTSEEFETDLKAHLNSWDSYLCDADRINIYKKVIFINRHLFCGRTVLNVSCGIGILSLFAAKAGAAHVYAVDDSNVVDYLVPIAAANGYADVIQVFKGRIENINLPTKDVDIIISDWMGYSLLFKSDIRAVIYARDKWLKPHGLIFPDSAKLYIAPVEDGIFRAECFDYWNNVYGFKMSCLRKCALAKPLFHEIGSKQVLGEACCVKSLDLNKATCDDLNFNSKYKLKIFRSGVMDAIVSYFSVNFTKSHTPVWLHTTPGSSYTYWFPTLFFFNDRTTVRKGEQLFGNIAMKVLDETGTLEHIGVHLELFGGQTDINLQVEKNWTFTGTQQLAAEFIRKYAEDAKNAENAKYTEEVIKETP